VRRYHHHIVEAPTLDTSKGPTLGCSVLAIVVFGVFFLGAVFAYQAFVGKEINPHRTHALKGASR
jgi:hypothetical protein